MTPPTSVQTVTAELLPLTFEGIEDFLCEGNCKNPGMCNDTEITWCGRKAEAFVKSIATLTSSLTAAEARLRELEAALRNVMGAYDTPVSRRRFPPDDFMKEALNVARAALSQTEEGPR